MVQILEVEGHLTNAEVLNFIKQKRAQYAQEDGADKSAKRAITSRPKTYLTALDKHERHLTSEHYPYARNPSAYSTSERQQKALSRFQELHMERIQTPLAQAYGDRVRTNDLTVKEAQKELEEEQEKKELTETELLMIDNHAPTGVELLQPMIEQVEERFTTEELDVLVQCVRESYRIDQYGMGQGEG